jgi:NADPH2:quinone reductase
MKIYRVNEPNGDFVETIVPDPAAKAGEVLVRIRASGVNPLDTKIRAGQAAHAKQPLPAVLGLDMAGVVEEVGEGVTAFKRGDEVYGMTGGVGGLQGSLAEFVAADANLLAHKPKRLSMREAAALPLSVITAWEGLVDRAGVHAGQTVLVHAGAGGVGHVGCRSRTPMGRRCLRRCRRIRLRLRGGLEPRRSTTRLWRRKSTLRTVRAAQGGV